MIYLIAVITVIILAYLVVQFSIFIPGTKGLPVLLYHKVSKTHTDNLTILPETFEQHLIFLNKKGYTTVSMQELIAFQYKHAPLPQKPVMITFDDGYVNNFELAYPLLKQYKSKAVFFIPSAGIGKTNWWDKEAQPLMNAQQLLNMDSNLIELGLHSNDHKNYKHLTPKQIGSDIQESISTLRQMNITFVPAFAYPYGGRPKDKTVYSQMLKIFTEAGIKFAFRIGNKVNKLPIKQPFEIKRIIIQGTGSMWTFKTKLRKGRVKLF
jgi:peptidoglycan/xylan/chitin deacetylase (PgdA/CDA1 family)